MRTLGRRIIHLDPARGFAAEAVSAVVLYVAALQFHAPVSTTHTISSAIMGVGATKRLSAVRWGVARSMVVAWVLTLPAAGLFAARPLLRPAPLPLTTSGEPPTLPDERKGGELRQKSGVAGAQPKRPEM